jgi:hypothetical protein
MKLVFFLDKKYRLDMKNDTFKYCKVCSLKGYLTISAYFLSLSSSSSFDGGISNFVNSSSIFAAYSTLSSR